MQLSVVVLCLAFAGASALQACTSASDCRCPHFPPGMRAICSQQACHCHTGSTCKTASDCSTCPHGSTVTCDEDAPGMAFCHCNGHEAPPQMQKCTTADTCHDCPNQDLNKICHNGECQCHFDNECETASDCYTCPHFTQQVTCESSNCHCDGHQAPPKAPTCNSITDCPSCPVANMTQACLNNECHCHMPGECKIASDCTTCPPDVTSVTCDLDNITGEMFCHCDGHPAPIHGHHPGGPSGFHGFHGGN